MIIPLEPPPPLSVFMFGLAISILAVGIGGCVVAKLTAKNR